MERRHVSILVVTILATLLAWVTLSWQQSKDVHSSASVRSIKTSSTLSSSTNNNQNLYQDYDGRKSHSQSSFMFSSQSSSPPQWFQSYIQWHDQQLRTNATKYSFLMYTCTRQGGSCGGVGDRLNGMIQSFYTAMCNRRVFLIEYDTPYPLTKSLIPNQIQWNAKIPNVALLLRSQSDQIQHLNFMDYRTIPGLIEPAVLQEKEKYRQARGWMIQTNLWMEKTMPTTKCLLHYIRDEEGKKQKHKDVILDADDLYRWAFNALFQISDLVMERTRQIQNRTGLLVLTSNTTNTTTTPSSSFFTEDTTARVATPNTDANDLHHNATNDASATASSLSHPSQDNQTGHTTTTTSWTLQPYVAMHIRTGHGSTWGGDPLRHSGNHTLSKFRQCAKRLQQRLATKLQSRAAPATPVLPLPLIYVASDNVDVKRQFEEWDNSCFRYDHLLNVVHADKTRDPPLDSYLDVWAEMVVLWQAKALVMSVSKFSQLAEVLGQFTNDTARYFDQCDFNETIGDAALIPMNASSSPADISLPLVETASPTHHDHRDQADETYVETRKTRRTKRSWLAF